MSSIPKFKTKQAPYVHVATPWPTKRQSFRADSADKGSEGEKLRTSNFHGQEQFQKMEKWDVSSWSFWKKPKLKGEKAKTDCCFLRKCHQPQIRTIAH